MEQECKEHVGNVQILNLDKYHGARYCSAALIVMFNTYVTENTTILDATTATRRGQNRDDA